MLLEHFVSTIDIKYTMNSRELRYKQWNYEMHPRPSWRFIRSMELMVTNNESYVNALYWTRNDNSVDVKWFAADELD